MELQGKTVVVGIAGGIAAYKMCETVSRLKKAGADVHVLLTENGGRFVTALTLETLSNNRVVTGMFDRDFQYDVRHVSLAKKADLLLIAPATANIIAKLAHGLADDMPTTAALAATCPKLICPAMNEKMLENPATQANIRLLEERGFEFLEPGTGFLACGDTGKGRMAEPADIVARAEEILLSRRDYAGKTVLVTAGATIEDIDGVRFISNRSSGKMGCMLAKAASERGAKVILVAGRITAAPPAVETFYVNTTEEMRDRVMENLSRADIVIKAAAPSDYSVRVRAPNKIKSENLILDLKKTPDIAQEVGQNKGGKKLVIFCAETENLIANAAEKLRRKNADLLVANDVTLPGAGFETDTNIVTLIDGEGNREDFGILPKYKLSHIILDRILRL
jgi:phosphopantothenoylcysteine decarboxylase/phosphopantothenate--cysteine ligase